MAKSMKLNEKFIEKEYSDLMLKETCCKRKFYQNFTVLDICRLRPSFFSKREQDQNQFILDFFKSSKNIFIT